jgi:hypothetical protein
MLSVPATRSVQEAQCVVLTGNPVLEALCVALQLYHPDHLQERVTGNADAK